MTSSEAGEAAGWLPLEQAWRAWGPDDAVRELDAVGEPGPGMLVLGGPETEADRQRGRRWRAAQARDAWLAGEISAGRMELEVTRDLAAGFAATSVPRWSAKRLRVESGWRLFLGEEELADPRLRLTEGAVPASAAWLAVRPADQAERVRALRALTELLVLELRRHPGWRVADVKRRARVLAPWVTEHNFSKTIIPELAEPFPRIRRAGRPRKGGA